MVDEDTLIVTYNDWRGEPRGSKRDHKKHPEIQYGDCIDCGLCHAVCPTGIDIRDGQQLACITCALCIDACDAVMEKIGKPKGLIRYASLDEMEGKKQLPLYRRPRPLIYISILTLSLLGIGYGLTHLGTIELKVLHDRAPLFVQLSDGSIQNKYRLKILNKSDKDFHVKVTASGIPGLELKGADEPLYARKGGDTSYTVYLKAPQESLKSERTPVVFKAQGIENPEMVATYESMFFAPK